MRPRLAYRDVASSTNRLSLIAAILPAGVVTTHSLFCLKTRLSSDNQAFLCGMLNSFVANYLVRRVMTTHLGSATVEGLRVPKPRYDSVGIQERLWSLLARAREAARSEPDHARLQALAARCYGLTVGDFEHVLSTFPLVTGVGTRRKPCREIALRELQEISASACRYRCAFSSATRSALLARRPVGARKARAGVDVVDACSNTSRRSGT